MGTVGAGRDEVAGERRQLIDVAYRLLGSARARRERYVGAWLPEPLPGRPEGDHAGGADPTGPADPADQIVLDESVAMAFLVVLESMTPAERVAFVLHDVFRYPFAEIADVLGRTPAACKQLASAARRRVGGGARITQYMVAIADKDPGLELLERSVNRVPGLVARRAGVVMTVAAFDASDGRVTRIWAVRNPEKLRPWAREGRPAALP
ncbi:sigma factor-like helix-turn-helix DNA-binding protein [Streptomyces lydicus]|uniref:sigma factor-like helix-turn-helix DNA-binding protein n=1 Tax=Streptomyces lydicus TaxID=47763 RepID=UPI003794D9DA